MSAKLSRKEKGATGWTLGVVLEDGSERLTTTNDLTDAFVEAFARSEAAKLGAISPTGKTHYNIGDAIPLDPPVPPQPTVDEQVHQQFIADKHTVENLQAQADFRVIAQDDPALLAAYDALKISSKPEYWV